MRAKFFRPFYGDDIFISYSRADASLYAAGLADELTKRRISCFIDQLGTDPEHDLPASLIEKIKRCTVCVLVGTPKALDSAPVKQEIEIFKQTKRTIIPIYFDNAPESSSLYAVIPGLARSDEKRETLDTGVPSSQVISRIEKSFNYTTRNERMRLILIGATTVLIALLALIGWAGLTARAEIKRANEQTDIANRATEKANEQQRIVEEQKKIAEEAKVEASKQTEIARDAKNEALKQQEIAKIQQQEANKQGRIANSRRIIAAAELEKNQGEDRFILPVQKALEAYQIHPSFEVDSMLRYGLDRLPRSVARLKHPGPVKMIAFHPDGQHLSTLSTDFTARVWNVATGAEITSLKYSEKAATVLLSPNGLYVAITYSQADAANQFTSIFTLNTKREIARLSHNAPIVDVCFNKNGEYLVTASADHMIKVWRLPSGIENKDADPAAITQISTIQAEATDKIILSPDGKLLAVIVYKEDPDDDDPSSYATIWRVSPAQKLLTTPGDRLTISDDGESFSYSFDGTVWVNELAPEKENREKFRRAGPNLVTSVAFKPKENDIFATAESNGAVKIYDLYEDGKQLLNIEHETKVNYVAFAPFHEGDSFLTITDDNTAHLWFGSVRGKHIRFFEAMRMRHHDRINAVIVSPDQRYLATAGEDNEVNIWERTPYGAAASFSHEHINGGGELSDDRRYVTVELRHEAWIWDVAARRIVWSKKAPDWQDLPPVSLHGDQLFTRNIETNVVEGWDLRQGKQFASLALPAVATPAAVIGYSNDWSYFATKTGARQVQIWERASQRILASLPLAADALKVSFSANGQFCILETSDYNVSMLETKTGRKLIGPINANLEFSRDEKFVAYQSDKHTVRLYDIETGNEKVELRHPAEVWHITWSPDSRFLAVECRDSTLWLWNRAGNRIATVKADAGIERFVFSPRGTRLAISDDGGNVWLINTADGSRSLPFKHGATVSQLAFTSDDRFLATLTEADQNGERQSDQNTITIWDLLNRNRVIRIEYSEVELSNITFTDRDQHLLVISKTRIDHLPWQTQSLADEARVRLSQMLR